MAGGFAGSATSWRAAVVRPGMSGTSRTFAKRESQPRTGASRSPSPSNRPRWTAASRRRELSKLAVHLGEFLARSSPRWPANGSRGRWGLEVLRIGFGGNCDHHRGHRRTAHDERQCREDRKKECKILHGAGRIPGKWSAGARQQVAVSPAPCPSLPLRTHSPLPSLPEHRRRHRVGSCYRCRLTDRCVTPGQAGRHLVRPSRARGGNMVPRRLEALQESLCLEGWTAAFRHRMLGNSLITRPLISSGFCKSGFRRA